MTVVSIQVIVTFCGAVFGGTIESHKKCRQQYVSCMTRALHKAPDRSESDLLNECLDDYRSFPNLVSALPINPSVVHKAKR